MEWPSPAPFESKMGFPGWHLECSAMSVKYLGQPFDIHCGGVDHLAIHHPNEIAQSEAATDKKMCNYWLHGEFLLVDGGRMGKSEGNAFTLAELIAKGFDPMVFRYACLLTHYRQKMNFTWDAMASAKTAYEALSAYTWGNDEAVSAKAILDEVFGKLADDLNTPEAIGALWRFVRSGIPSQAEKKAGVLSVFKLLGLIPASSTLVTDIPPEVQKLLEARATARTNKDYALADTLRQQISALGFAVEDTADGQQIKRN